MTAPDRGRHHDPVGHLPDRLGELDPARPIAVYCAGGYRSAVAANPRRRHGFSDVNDIVGGYDVWHQTTQNA